MVLSQQTETSWKQPFRPLSLLSLNSVLLWKKQGQKCNPSLQTTWLKNCTEEKNTREQQQSDECKVLCFDSARNVSDSAANTWHCYDQIFVVSQR